jgi:hypothetical protein
MAQAVSIRLDQLSIKQKSFAIEWTTISAWNSTDNIVAEVERRVKAQSSKAVGAGRSQVSRRSAKALASTASSQQL